VTDRPADAKSAISTDPIMASYYAAGVEKGRLEATNRLEFERTKVLLSERLPSHGRIVDVGGGPGTYASWLAGRGYEVDLIDPIPLHVEQARRLAQEGPSFGADVGDARALSVGESSADAVVMMGPLFHLVDPGDRAAALAEARRVLRPGGVLLATAMGRQFLLGHAIASNTIRSRPERHRVLSVAATGLRVDPPVPFPAYAHLPEELANEVGSAGFGSVEVLAIEGFFHLLDDLSERLRDPARCAALLEALHLVEREPAVVGASGHIMAVAVRD
jgi:SAM-dependent methyltransferase